VKLDLQGWCLVETSGGLNLQQFAPFATVPFFFLKTSLPQYSKYIGLYSWHHNKEEEADSLFLL